MLFKLRCAVFFTAVVATAVYSPKSAHAIDCAKPSSPIDKIICSSKQLSAKDRELAAVYTLAITEAKARIPEEATTLRDSQRKWIAERDRKCGGANQDEARAVACLAKVYDARIAHLLTKTVATKPNSASPSVNGTHANASAPKDVAKVPVKPVTEPPLTIDRTVASAKFPVDEVPAAGEGHVFLTVEAPGRFSIRAQSKTGVALQLVDMIAGPGAMTGDPGVRDGRLDVLLDKGVYKIRTFGAEKAPGAAKLTVLPFRETADTFPHVSSGYEGRLSDLEQRSFALRVGKDGRVAVEAAGRSLQDLRLWRDGTDLANLSPEFGVVEPKSGQPLTRARLEGTVEPGLYVVTAYGGEKLAWTDGTQDEPFRIRTIESRSLTAGVAEGVVGPFGSQRFELSSSATYLRLELPDVAPAQLRATRGTAVQVARIAKNNREPVAALHLPANGNTGRAEIVGLEGQKFRIIAVTSSRDLPIAGTGTHIVSVDVAGESADELPATAVLTRFADGKATAVASSAPRLGVGQAWRRRFNLRGVSGLIFEKTVAGPVAIRAEGPAVKATIEPLLAGIAAPRSDGKTPEEYNLEAGWYMLRVEPVDGAQGVLDLTLGQPGLLPPPMPPVTHRVTIPFGVQQLERGATYRILTGYAPHLVTGPKAVALPVDLSKEAVAVFQSVRSKVRDARLIAHDNKAVPPKPAPAKPGKPENKPGAAAPAPANAESQTREAPLEIQVRVPLGGTISVADIHGEPLDASLSGEKVDGAYRTITVKIPAAKADRTVILSWTADKPNDAPISLSARPAAIALAAGKPHHFDLKRDEERSFELTVAEGGLYRVETLGRLKTSLRLANAFLPNLANAASNGPGHNALLQTYLRAGAYRVAVKVSESAGRLGLTASHAPLLNTETLVPEGSVRASLSDGKGAVIPIEIAEAGDYRFDLYSLGRELTARLEDSEGWPLAKPGPLSKRTERLSAGRYRLVILPEAVDARLVARLRRVVTEPQREGHGPHPLAFGKSHAHQWREPATKDAPRDPDRWEFALEGEATVSLDISEGMVGDLIQQGGATVARITGEKGFAAPLPAGRYSFDVRSQGRNDRLDYQITLQAAEIQPATPHYVYLPANIPFSIGDGRVVSLTTFGREGLSASLRDADGNILERLSSRTDDWNIAMSRHLPAGKYSLLLRRLNEGADSYIPDEAATSVGDVPGTVEVRLALPKIEVAEALMLDKAVTFTASGARQFPLPPTEAGRLMVVAAEADAEIVASLEREENGRWTAIAFERGRSPALSWPTDGNGAKLRLSVWSIDGGPAQIAVSATAVKAQAEEPGKIALKPIALDGLKGKYRAALVHAPLAGLINLAGMHQGLTAGATPGQALQPATGGVIIPQLEQLWFLSRGDGEAVLQLEAQAGVKELALALGEGEKATLPQAPMPSGKLRLWRADSTLGQPGLDAGEGVGAANGSALALVGKETLRVWNAGGREHLRLTLTPVEVALLPEVTAEPQAGALLSPRAALPVRVKGEAQIEFNLAPGTAAIVRSASGRKVTIWAASEAVSRTIEGEFSDVLLINTGNNPAPARMTISPAKGTAAALTSAKVYKRFFGAAGSLSLGLDAKAGDRLVVVGGVATFTGAGGEIQRGRTLALAGPGEVTLEHGAGLLAAWIERKGASPWPSVRGSSVDLPSSVELEGEAMRFKLESQTAVLLHARTTSPVILAFSQGADDAPQLYPAGAVFDRYLAPGEADLRLYSPHDGPLGGRIELTATPIITVSEGLGEPVTVAPGATALFGFELKRGGLVGTGVRSEPDRVSARLMDASGKVLGEGVNIITKLEPGHYFLEARVPTDSGASIVRPSVVGVAPPPGVPPAEVVEKYLDMAGMKPKNER